jgi:hypothetical protein
VTYANDKHDGGVPPDGFCFYYSTAGVQDSNVFSFSTTKARAIRTRFLAYLDQRNLGAMSTQLRKDGVAGFPDETSYPHMADMLEMCFAIYKAGYTKLMVYGRQYGNGAIRVILRNHEVFDKQGHEEWHYSIIWLSKYISSELRMGTNGELCNWLGVSMKMP